MALTGVEMRIVRMACIAAGARAVNVYIFGY